MEKIKSDRLLTISSGSPPAAEAGTVNRHRDSTSAVQTAIYRRALLRVVREVLELCFFIVKIPPFFIR